MPVGKHTIVFARIVPSELNIVTTENNNVIDLALCCQLRDPATGDDIWQTRGANTVAQANMLSWQSFVGSFYGGGDGDFAVSQVAGRMLTMVGVSGEYANGVPQHGSALTHMSDRARTDSSGSGATAQVSVSGVSVLNDVIDSVVYDLGLPHDAWDSCSYMNVVNQLQDIHSVGDVARVSGKTQQSCALSISALVHEIASNYDENMGLVAGGADAGATTSAVFQLYNNGLEAAITTAMGDDASNAAALDANRVHILVLSVMFKNSTPGVRNVEFRIHFQVTNNDIDGDSNNCDGSLESLCKYSSEEAHFLLDGTQA
tara:strand:- start:745 stop:1692 length:948 start_codon:yes stop_codon:yes gene_type:complete